MPRAFLIKKRSPTREVAASKPRISEVETENNGSSILLDLSPAETRGPFDLSIKHRNFDVDMLAEVETDPPLQVKPPPSVIEFSPKIVSSYSTDTPPIAVAMIDRQPSPNHLFKQGSPLEPLNPNTPPSSRTSPWHRPFLGPTYPPFNFPLYPLPRHASDFYNGPASYLGSSLISPPLLPLSPPRSTLGMGFEPLSPCIPRENVSPQSSFYGNHPLPDHLHIEHPVARKELPVYHSPWIHKEGSTSPIPRSDSSDSGRDSATNTKNSTMVSSSTRGGGFTGGQAPRYQCVDCNKSYSTYSGLSRHRQFHCITQAKKSFNCKYCEKVYVSLGALKMHIRTHTLPCKCKLCGKAFSRPWLLQGHIRTHTGEKPFACPHCSRAFADRSNLRAHLQTHSDVKKYSCKTCSKTFSRMSLLLKHGDGSCIGSQPR